MIYFAQDGSFGNASGMIIVDTRTWSAEEWAEVENATDDERVAIAIRIARENGDRL